MKKFMIPSEGARLLSVTAERLRQLERKGEISAIRTVGEKRIFLKEHVLRLAEDRRSTRERAQCRNRDARR